MSWEIWLFSSGCHLYTGCFIRTAPDKRSHIISVASVASADLWFITKYDFHSTIHTPPNLVFLWLGFRVGFHLDFLNLNPVFFFIWLFLPFCYRHWFLISPICFSLVLLCILCFLRHMFFLKADALYPDALTYSLAACFPYIPFLFCLYSQKVLDS